ncbi:MAG TPA: hypothetical protein VL754_12365 [Verrucomicrobiae bacterium]|jgi:hypothetical protein|nr:hypothetical protein [Verrucomicrobiae bacterium]
MRATAIKSSILAALLIAGPGLAGAQSPDAVPQWEMTITGVSSGFAVMSFSPDGKLFGYLVIKPAKINPANRPPEVLLGFTFVDGAWTLDAAGHLTGFFSGDAKVPLDMSFKGKVKPGPVGSIAIKATGNGGVWSMKGIPITIPAVSGLDGTQWTASIVENPTGKSVEIFDLTAATICIDDPPPADPVDCVETASPLNLFSVAGQGPGYVIRGYLMVGTRGKIGFAVEELLIDKDKPPPDNIAESGVIRSVLGKLNLKNGQSRATMKGADDGGANAQVTIFMSP